MEISLEPVKYKYKNLSPIMSEDTLKYHRDKLAAGYVKKFNEKDGDLEFNEAGAFLHNIFFTQFKSPTPSNKPLGHSKEFIEKHFNSFNEFIEEITSVAMSFQGSGWIYLSRSGSIKTIKNHQIKNDIILLIDWWEHAWALDYKSRKDLYIKNIWKIIDWTVINERLNLSKLSRFDRLTRLVKYASKLSYPKEFRRWLWREYYKNKINQNYDNLVRIRLSNNLFNEESEASKKEIFNQWKKLNPHENMIKLYHRTDPVSAREIYNTGVFSSKINKEVYFSNKEDGQNSGYGSEVICIEIPEQYANIDDEFPDGEKHYWVRSDNIENFGIIIQPENKRKRELEGIKSLLYNDTEKRPSRKPVIGDQLKLF